MKHVSNRRTAILLYNDAQRKKAEAVVSRMVKRAVELEGTVSVSRELFGKRLTKSLNTDLIDRESMALAWSRETTCLMSLERRRWMRCAR